jgi:hypothetical protein
MAEKGQRRGSVEANDQWKLVRAEPRSVDRIKG